LVSSMDLESPASTNSDLRKDSSCFWIKRGMQKPPELLRELPTIESWQVVSSLVPEHPLLLPTIRFIFAAYMLAAYVGCLVSMEVPIRRAFFYLTNLGYMSLFLYFLLSGYSSLKYAVRCIYSRPLERKVSYPPNSPYWTFVQLVYTVNFPVHCVICLIYWSLLHQETLKMYPDMPPHYVWMNLTAHGLTVAMLFVEFVLNRQRMYLIHIIHYLILCGLYMVWTKIGSYINSEDGVEWHAYPILNSSQNPAHLYYLGVFMASLVLYLLVFFLHWIKYSLITPSPFVLAATETLLKQEIVLVSKEKTVHLPIITADRECIDADVHIGPVKGIAEQLELTTIAVFAPGPDPIEPSFCGRQG